MNPDEAGIILAAEIGIKLVRTKENIRFRINCFTFEEWDINDSVIREIVRQKLEIDTVFSTGFFVGWTARTTKIRPGEGQPYKIYQGKTISQAEVSCCVGVAADIKERKS